MIWSFPLPAAFACLDLKVIIGYFCTSRKFGLRRSLSRICTRVSTELASLDTSTESLPASAVSYTADAGKGSVDVSIDASSVDTRVQMRDNDLRSPNFLEVQKYPMITFKSKQAKAAGSGKLQIIGDLTIHGVTKEVVLDVDGPSAPIKDPWGNQRIGASASTKINRKDFGVNGLPGVVGDDINITIDTELIQPQPK